MRSTRLLLLVAAVILLLAAGCLPTKGTPVFVDFGAGDYWSGKGVLVEVSPDETQCRVVVRDSTLVRTDEWVPCKHVHPRKMR